MLVHTDHPGRRLASPVLIEMSLRQDIPGGLLSSRARFRFSCRTHSAAEAICSLPKNSERQLSPIWFVSELDAVQVTVPPSDRRDPTRRLRSGLCI